MASVLLQEDDFVLLTEDDGYILLEPETEGFIDNTEGVATNFTDATSSSATWVKQTDNIWESYAWETTLWEGYLGTDFTEII